VNCEIGQSYQSSFTYGNVKGAVAKNNQRLSERTVLCERALD